MECGGLRTRRQFVGAAAGVASAMVCDVRHVLAWSHSTAIKAVAFDAFAIFDSAPVSRLMEEFFPGRGPVLSERWRTRQFEYTWLCNSMHRYTDFWHVTEDALDFAIAQSGVVLAPDKRARLMAAYLELQPWPGVAAALQTLRERSLRFVPLSNMTAATMQACLQASKLEQAFEFQLSTDDVKVFKPDPAAYQMGCEALQLRQREIAFVAFGGWDAAGAKAFGFPTYWVNRFGLPVERLRVRADAIRHDLAYLPAFLEHYDEPGESHQE